MCRVPIEARTENYSLEATTVVAAVTRFVAAVEAGKRHRFSP